jgi:hypothetical protein
MIDIKLIYLGHSRFNTDKALFQNYKSKVFRISSIDTIDALPDAKGDDWSYSDNQTSQII